MDFDHPFLTDQIIAYIGNKRKLLPLIYSAIKNTGLNLNSGIKFLDLFSGSGVVSRLAKFLNFEVFSNDWEYYSNVINHGFLETDKSDLKKLFGSEGIEKLFDKINSLTDPHDSEQYIAKYYGPKEFDIEKVNGKIERLFYTRENALIIDRIRNWLELNFTESEYEKKNLILALLLYEAATHTNTSGVFKAFHKEFGGHGKDAMKRITQKIELHSPVLIDSDYPVHIYQEDANLLVRKLPEIDIAYLDPPYNQHQYGSNYHMLNTIAKWDKIPAPLVLNEKGELKEKAAIRHDWISTKSNYCYKTEAEKSFEDLILNIKARFILISYSTDGIIPFEKMREICTKRGRLSLVTNEYTTYRGGKQSNKRQNSNIEFILCVDTSKKSDEESVKAVDLILKRKKALLMFKQKYRFDELKKNFEIEDNLLKIKLDKVVFRIKNKDFFTLEIPDEIYELNENHLDEFCAKLSACVCETKEDELKEVFLRLNWEHADKKKLAKLIPGILNKLANNKNKIAYSYWIKRIENLKSEEAELYSFIEEKISKIKEIAARRITN